MKKHCTDFSKYEKTQGGQYTARHGLADVPARPIERRRHLASARGTRSRELSTATGVH